MKRVILWLACCVSWAIAGPPAILPSRVVVVYNASLPESEKLAKVYQKARSIPTANLVGLELPDREEITRQEYDELIRKPLREEFEKRVWWRLGEVDAGREVAVENRMQVMVCMRGVPLKIARLAAEPGSTKASNNGSIPANQQPLAEANEASVDSELAVLSWSGQPLNGPLRNAYFESQQGIEAAALPDLLLVGRIDGPSYQICERMIRDAVSTETHGLWGRVYVDMAQFYPEGEAWLRSCGLQSANEGIPVIMHPWKEVFSKHYPMSEAAAYFGWYEWNACGPFANPTFRLRPGAVAVHLHSFSAATVRSETMNWCGPLLARGAAVTLGNVYEPYLGMTHHLDQLQQRLLQGFSWIEAAYASMPVVSWQGVVLGDPLYRPYLHMDGTGEKRPEDRSYRALRVAKLLYQDQDRKMLHEIERIGRDKKNAIMMEALGLLHLQRKQEAQALQFISEAKTYYPLPADRLRCDLHLIGMDRDAGRTGMAIKQVREAEILYAEMPEVESIKSLRAILDPPPPPPPAAGQAPKK
ncbi:MAG: hypothetical protein RLZZ224_439 [Verrucomicrobiota bacterium]